MAIGQDVKIKVSISFLMNEFHCIKLLNYDFRSYITSNELNYSKTSMSVLLKSCFWLKAFISSQSIPVIEEQITA